MGTRGWALLVPAAAITVFIACSDARLAPETAPTHIAPEPITPREAPSRYSLQQQPLDFTTITVTTTALSSATGALNREHTCEGKDTSPPLSWSGVPANAKSLALLFEDPASDELGGAGLWVHWVVYDVTPDVTELAAALPAGADLEGGGMQGINDYENSQYNGPCPIPNLWWYAAEFTSGGMRHVVRSAETRRYRFMLYAVDMELALEPGAGRDDVLQEIDGHVLAAGIAELPYKSRKRVRIEPGCARAALTLQEAAKCILVR